MVATAIFLHFRPHRHSRLLLQNTTSSLRFSSSSSSNSDENDQNRISSLRKNLSVQPPQSPAPVISFQELYKRSVIDGVKREPLSIQSIRMSLKNMQQHLDPNRKSPLDGISQRLNLNANNIPSMMAESIAKTKSVEFVRMYSYGNLGEKLRKLRSGTKFSLEELNERLRMLRQDDGKTNKNAAQRFNVFGGTPSFMLSPPKKVLVQKYFHRDHMSSAEKQKLELKNVRDKILKISESDCGSARVQVAQLTTKIKHLATVVHKKDKHSRKGLEAMVQKRKKLFKYLRRTDWDIYCFCLSELGLRDNKA
ncbi:hypothetical protein L1887_28962 [Cichorium endivia]|nr:hypothetical protein L1887_28962 [Cichorium endivia]